MTYQVYKAIDVADALVRLALVDKKPLSNLKVQKLTYLVYGCWLGLTNFQMFQDRVEARKYSPVIPELYNQLARYGANFIQEPILEKNPIPEGSEEYQLIHDVYNEFKDLKAWQLVYLTHQKGSPWHQTYAPEIKGSIISPDLVRDYYKNLLSGSHD